MQEKSLKEMSDNILKYIPQRPPFVMVDRLIFCNSEQTQTEFTINNDNLFVVNNQLVETGIMENIAQTCAARLGYLNENQPVKIGMIGSVNNFELYSLPCANKKLITTITVTAEVLNVVMLSAKVFCDENLIAVCEMKVVLTDTVSDG